MKLPPENKISFFYYKPIADFSDKLVLIGGSSTLLPTEVGFSFRG